SLLRNKFYVFPPGAVDRDRKYFAPRHLQLPFLFRELAEILLSEHVEAHAEHPGYLQKTCQRGRSAPFFVCSDSRLLQSQLLSKLLLGHALTGAKEFKI